MIRRHSRPAALLVTVLMASAVHADLLHPLADGAYWHHDSNFIFPAALAGFARVGAPQDLDGSTTVISYYARGESAARFLVVIEVSPVADAAVDAATSAGGFVRIIDHAGWRIVVRATLPDPATAAAIETLVRALPVDRLGAIDTRCPNAGCGTGR